MGFYFQGHTSHFFRFYFVTLGCNMNTTIVITTNTTTGVFKSPEAQRRKQNQQSSGQGQQVKDCLSPRLPLLDREHCWLDGRQSSVQTFQCKLESRVSALLYCLTICQKLDTHYKHKINQL
jgi:hypothetical protein